MHQELNGHAVGIILKELVRRAMTIIRNERQVFEATAKQGHTGNMDDVFTSADTKAQEVYIKSLRECFPDCAIVAEEGLVNQLPAPHAGYHAPQHRRAGSHLSRPRRCRYRGSGPASALPVAGRGPIRPTGANQVWSYDLVFDWCAAGQPSDVQR
jgi:hypothetical protein